MLGLYLQNTRFAIVDCHRFAARYESLIFREKLERATPVLACQLRVFRPPELPEFCFSVGAAILGRGNLTRQAPCPYCCRIALETIAFDGPNGCALMFLTHNVQVPTIRLDCTICCQPTPTLTGAWQRKILRCFRGPNFVIGCGNFLEFLATRGHFRHLTV